MKTFTDKSENTNIKCILIIQESDKGYCHITDLYTNVKQIQMPK